MRKPVIIALLIIGLLLIAAGCAREELKPVVLQPASDNVSEASQPVNEIKVRAFQWGFEPNEIVVKKGDKVRLLITSSDVNHGFNIPEYNIDVHLSPGQTVPVEFTADKAGAFQAYCSVYCGEGHAGMKAKLIVKE